MNPDTWRELSPASRGAIREILELMEAGATVEVTVELRDGDAESLSVEKRVPPHLLGKPRQE